MSIWRAFDAWAGARAGPSGELVLLLDQDRVRWDRLLINRGPAALARAGELGGTRGSYVLQAAIAACHATALRPAARAESQVLWSAAALSARRRRYRICVLLMR